MPACTAYLCSNAHLVGPGAAAACALYASRVKGGVKEEKEAELEMEKTRTQPGMNVALA